VIIVLRLHFTTSSMKSIRSICAPGTRLGESKQYVSQEAKKLGLPTNLREYLHHLRTGKEGMTEATGDQHDHLKNFFLIPRKQQSSPEDT